jgi:type III restriction enzyme
MLGENAVSYESNGCRVQFRFDEQPHQLAAVAAVCDAIDGSATGVLPNEELLSSNSQIVQRRNGLREEQAVQYISARSFVDEIEARAPHLAVEMETGTGKTYAYIRTALTVSARYGYRRFVIVVPSIAIRETVLQTFGATYSHFRQHAETRTLDYKWAVYDSDQEHIISTFCRPDSVVRFLITTLASFNQPERNRMYREPEAITLWSGAGTTFIRRIQHVTPVVILDEPQNMTSDLSRRAIVTLSPALVLSYSATLPPALPKTTLFRYGPQQAETDALVKRVFIRGIESPLQETVPVIRVNRIVVARRGRSYASIAVLVQSATGLVERELEVNVGDDLEELTARAVYQGWEVESLSQSTVSFSNGAVLSTAEELGTDRSATWRDLLSNTIRAHFDRQIAVQVLGVDLKVLSLFFVDQVADYDAPDAPLPALFDECYREICATAKYREFHEEHPSSRRLHYFAQTARGESRDTSNRDVDVEFERRAYKLIMERKEDLLDPKEAGAFIFSHSALAEGWDNPNVFQICFLRRTRSVVRRRQQIGRGLRIPVDASGVRTFDPAVRKLTLVVNESYESFVAGLNAEYDEDGVPRKLSERTRIRKDGVGITVARNDAVFASDEFRAAWADVSRQGHATFSVDRESLVAEFCRDPWDEFTPLRTMRNVVQQVEIRQADTREYRVIESDETKAFKGEKVRSPAVQLDLLGLLEDVLAQGATPVALSRLTLKAILSAVPENERQGLAVRPESWIRLLAERIRFAFASSVVQSSQYSLLPGTAFSVDDVFRETEEALEYDVDLKRGAVRTNNNNPLYSHALCDSAVEREYVESCLTQFDGIECFAKLPQRFSIATPVGQYTPDWLVRYRGQTLVRETKSTLRASERRDIENVKIEFARRFFEQLGPAVFAVETDNPATFLADQG